MNNNKSNGGRVLQGEEKNAVLRQALKEQGYSDSDIAVMLGNSRKTVDGKKSIKSTRVVKDMQFRDFQPWSGGKETYDIIMGEHKDTQMDAMLEEMYPDGITDSELNALLWYNKDEVLQWLGIDEQTYNNYMPVGDGSEDLDPSVPHYSKVAEDEFQDYESEDEMLGNSRKVKKNKKDSKKKKAVKSGFDMSSEDDYNDYLDGDKHPQESEGRVLEGEEKNAVLTEVLKQQGYNDNDIAVMLGQSVKKIPNR